MSSETLEFFNNWGHILKKTKTKKQWEMGSGFSGPSFTNQSFHPNLLSLRDTIGGGQVNINACRLETTNAVVLWGQNYNTIKSFEKKFVFIDIQTCESLNPPDFNLSQMTCILHLTWSWPKLKLQKLTAFAISTQSSRFVRIESK